MDVPCNASLGSHVAALAASPTEGEHWALLRFRSPTPPIPLHRIKNILTEFIGTFFLVLPIGLTVTANSEFAPLAIGCALMIMVYMGGHISGGHYNPAVSLAAVMRGALPAGQYGTYVISQISGALAAALVVYVITGKTFAPAPAADASTIAALWVEILYTFALCLVVLNVAVAKKTQGNSYLWIGDRFHCRGGLPSPVAESRVVRSTQPWELGQRSSMR